MLGLGLDYGLGFSLRLRTITITSRSSTASIPSSHDHLWWLLLVPDFPQLPKSTAELYKCDHGHKTKISCCTTKKTKKTKKCLQKRSTMRDFRRYDGIWVKRIKVDWLTCIKTTFSFRDQARIKKIMQTDEDIGKVAAPVPVILCILSMLSEISLQKF